MNLILDTFTVVVLIIQINIVAIGQFTNRELNAATMLRMKIKILPVATRRSSPASPRSMSSKTKRSRKYANVFCSFKGVHTRIREKKPLKVEIHVILRMLSTDAS